MRVRLFRPLLALVASAAIALPAHADFHLMKVAEVFTGTAAAPNAKYVELQMYAANQGNLQGHHITLFDAAGTLVDTFTFGTMPANMHPSQEKVFVATTEAVNFFNLPADLTMNADMAAAGGKVCFDSIPVDCVAWGGYAGSATGVGTPFDAPAGIPGGRAAKRRLDIAGSPTLLENADDTDHSSTDFIEGLPAPRNIHAVNGTIPSAMCGNGALQGLEQCDDGNLANGDACSSTCEVTTPDLPTLSIADAGVSEGNSGTKLAVFTVSLSKAAATAVTYDIATATGTANAADYVPRSLAGETIPAGVLSKTFAVTINGDTTVEPDEAYAVNVANVTGATVADGAAVGTITNDDSPALSIFDASAAEGNAGTKLLSFLVRLDKASTVPVTFDIATGDDTATAGSDYVALALAGQSIPPGTLTKNITVTLDGDAAVEPNEKFNLTVGNVANATVADGAAVGTIINDDGPTLSIADITKVEGDAGTQTYNFVVRLSQPAAANVTFNVQTVQQSATAGSDYVAKAQSARVIPAGQTTFAFDVVVNGDTAIEPNEGFLVLVNAVAGPVTVADDRATGLIVNNEGPTLSIADVSLPEGNAGTQAMTFTVQLSQVAPGPVTFSVGTVAFSAAAGSDFVQKTLHNQAIPAGMLSKTFTATVNGDTAIEPNEQFIVLVNNTVGASALDDRAFGNLVNDDGPVLSIGDVSLAEGDAGTKLMSFIVRVDPVPANDVTYTVGTFDGSATAAGNDYTARTLVHETIAGGTNVRSFSVTLKGDTAVEPNETFGVRLSAPGGATIGDDTAIGTLVNDDGMALGTVVNDDEYKPYSIPLIQGDAPDSKLVGRKVVTEGVVTALVAGGFFLQDGAGDGDAATSDGLYVTAAAATSITIGDRVRVRGVVDEARIGDDVAQLTQTRLVARGATVLARGIALPAPVAPLASAWQPGAAATALERYEGMRVVLPAMTVVAPMGADGPRGDARFHVVAQGVPRPFREPGESVLDPHRAAGRHPPTFDANAEVLRVVGDAQREALPLAVDAGDTVAGLVGVLDYGAGRYQLLPDPRAQATVRAGARPGAVPMAAANEATLARLELGAYLAGAKRDAPDYRPRLAKAAQVLCRWLQAPAAVALPGADDAAVLADLAAQASLPAAGCTSDPRYRVQASHGSGVGLLLSQATVAGGKPRALLLAADPFAAANRVVAPDGTRLPVFAPAPQRWRLRLHAADGTPFELTALAVQFTALDDAPAAAGTHGWTTRGDALRAQRRAQAALLALVVQARQRAAPREALAVLGGFEAPQFSEGHEHLLGIVTGRTAARDEVLHDVASPVRPPLANLTAALPPAQRYTTTVAGDAQALDHVLVGAGLLRAYTPRVRVARIDADFGADNADDTTVPLRVSARDPLVLYLARRAPAD